MVLSYLIFCFAVLSTSAVPRKSAISDYPTLEEVLDSLMSLMQFFLKRFDQTNVDGIFGLRAVQGEMEKALAKADSGVYPTLSGLPELRKKIAKIRDAAATAADRALPEVKKRDEVYYTNFLPVIDKPWNHYELEPQLLKKIDEYLLPDTEAKDLSKFAFNEVSSDTCMGSLIGYTGKKCDVEKCWEMMTIPGTTLYYTTHQLLYLQLGIVMGCQSKFEERAKTANGLEKIFQSLCSNTIFQMNSLFRNGKVKNVFQDIFLEQGMICGSLGFMDAHNITWLKEALKWQNKEYGCYQETVYYVGDEHDPEFFRMMREQKDVWRKRELLEDVPMGDDCSSHKSAVAAGYLATQTRLFLDPKIVKQRLWPDLYGSTYSPSESTYFSALLLFGCVMVCVFALLMRRQRSRCFRLCFYR